MSEYISEYYEVFGVKTFHDGGFYGKVMSGPSLNTPIKVYVIDTGFDATNPDIAGVTVRNFSTGAGSPEEPSHGSLTCALLDSPANGYGIVGVCPDATVFLGDVDNSNGIITQSNVVNAINDAIAEGVDIISISLGSDEYTTGLETAIKNAVDAGIYVFSSAGNSGLIKYEYPASFPGVISVGSVNLDKQLSGFNTKNELVDIFAPGEDYYLPSSQGPVSVNGTSFSCPFAAGLWALHLSKERGTTPSYKPTVEEAITILRSAEYLDNGSLGYEALPSTELTASTWTSLGVVVGAFIVIVIIVYLVMSSFESGAAKKAAKEAAKERECVISGTC